MKRTTVNKARTGYCLLLHEKRSSIVKDFCARLNEPNPPLDSFDFCWFLIDFYWILLISVDFIDFYRFLLLLLIFNDGPGVDRCKANMIFIHFHRFLWIPCAQGVTVAFFGLMRYIVLNVETCANKSWKSIGIKALALGTWFDVLACLLNWVDSFPPWIRPWP